MQELPKSPTLYSQASNHDMPRCAYETPYMQGGPTRYRTESIAR